MWAELFVGAIVAVVIALLLDHWIRRRYDGENNDDPTEGLDL